MIEITLYPSSFLGKFLLAVGLKKPTTINLSFNDAGKFKVECNKKILHNVKVTFGDVFFTKFGFKHPAKVIEGRNA